MSITNYLYKILFIISFLNLCTCIKYLTNLIPFVQNNVIIDVQNNIQYQNYLESNNLKNKKIISISPGGIKGFYSLGILAYIKENYNLDNYVFSGASAGAWNSLVMCYNKNTNEFINDIFDDKINKIKSLSSMQQYIKDKLLNKYKPENFDLNRIYIGVTTYSNHELSTSIYHNFKELSDVIDCCVASSHIPLITGKILYKYKNIYSFDGGLSTYPYLCNEKTVLHITHSMWKNSSFIEKIRNYLMLPFYIIPCIHNYKQLYYDGYNDALKYKHELDKIFL
jgi:hypothetical protein